MTTSTENAIREMTAVFQAMRTAQYPTTDVLYDGVERNDPPPTDAPWFRFAIRHDPSGSRQASLSNQDGVRRWRRDGHIFVQCFGASKDRGITVSRRMAESVRDAYQGVCTPGGVWFRNAAAHEIGPDKSWYQSNAIIQFTYDEER